MFNIVMKAYYILGEPSNKAKLNYSHFKLSNIIGKRVVLSLQICEIQTAALVLKGSFLVVR